MIVVRKHVHRRLIMSSYSNVTSSADFRLVHNFSVFINIDEHSVRAKVHRYPVARCDFLNLKMSQWRYSHILPTHTMYMTYMTYLYTRLLTSNWSFVERMIAFASSNVYKNSNMRRNLVESSGFRRRQCTGYSPFRRTRATTSSVHLGVVEFPSNLLTSSNWRSQNWRLSPKTTRHERSKSCSLYPFCSLLWIIEQTICRTIDKMDTGWARYQITELFLQYLQSYRVYAIIFYW